MGEGDSILGGKQDVAVVNGDASQDLVGSCGLHCYQSAGHQRVQAFAAGFGLEGQALTNGRVEPPEHLAI